MVGWAALWLAGVVRIAPAEPQPISGANLADDCQFPGVVSFRAGEELCTGTMVHPQVLVTAAHCIAGGTPATVHFGETHSPYERKIEVARCVPYPEFAETDNATHDLGVCVLERPAEGLALVPLLTQCELAELEPGRVAVIVGYGVAEDGGTFGRKRYAFTTIFDELRDDSTLRVGDGGANGCIGDSGGPALIQLADGSWRAVGVLSRGPGCGAGADTYRVLADRIAWLEDESGFDLSPCVDDDGAWAPGEGCAELDADPRIAGATWLEFCDGPRMVPSPSCVMGAGDSSSSGGSESAATSTGEDGSGETTTGAAATPSNEGCGCRADTPRADEVLVLGIVLLSIAPPARRRRPSRARDAHLPARAFTSARAR